jgi:type III secretory pathway component EscS
MAMTTKEILLLVLILVMVAVIVCVNYFWGCPIHLLQGAVGLNAVSMAHVAKFAVAISGFRFL